MKGPKAVLRKWHYQLISMHLKCKDWRRFCEKIASKSARMAKFSQFSQGHPKPVFSEKVQKGNWQLAIGFSKSRIQELGRIQDFSFPNPEFKILADFKILAFQNPKFMILADFRILVFQNP